MCHPVAIAVGIGAATGAAGAAITGGDPLQGAILGGITGGLTYGISPTSFGATGMFHEVGMTLGASPFYASAVGFGATGLAGSIGMGLLTPKQQDYNQNLTGMPYTPQAYSSQHATVTGSGGRQAAAVLASEIKQAKSLRQRQAGAEDYGLGMDVAGTGLQIA